MIRWPAPVTVALVLLAGCNRVAERTAPVEQHSSGEAPVTFDLEPLPGGEGSRQWIGIYNSAGKIAKFKIDLGAAESTSGVKSGEGTLLPEPGSDASVLLADLQKALRGSTAPKTPQTKTSVPFTYVTIGDNLSQAGGGFNANPPGNWTAMKLVFGDGDGVSEVLLHVNAGTKKGQFSMKDPRFGDLALAELAKVL